MYSGLVIRPQSYRSSFFFKLLKHWCYDWCSPDMADLSLQYHYQKVKFVRFPDFTFGFWTATIIFISSGYEQEIKERNHSIFEKKNNNFHKICNHLWTFKKFFLMVLNVARFMFGIRTKSIYKHTYDMMLKLRQNPANNTLPIPPWILDNSDLGGGVTSSLLWKTKVCFSMFFLFLLKFPFLCLQA